MTDQEKSLVMDNLDLVRNTIIGVISRNESVQGMGYDDLFQTGCEALCHAAMNYQAEKGASFRTFASLVIRNRLISHCRIINRLQSPLQYLEEPLHDAEGTTLGDTLVCSATDTQKIEELDTLRLLQDAKRNYKGITKKGIEALWIKCLGHSSTEIASYYGVMPNHISAWISRAGSKLRNDRRFSCL